MLESPVGILGGTSFVGNHLIRLLTTNNITVTAYSRRNTDILPSIDGVVWKQLQVSLKHERNNPRTENSASLIHDTNIIQSWISVAPIWTLPDHFDLFISHGIRRIVALSSTSRFVKLESSNPFEKDVARRLSESEVKLQIWANTHNIDWIILRPTLIYGNGQDKNISAIANFIRKFGFFPLLGNAYGLRQPVHAEDVASACISALTHNNIKNQSYNISGGETLTYRDMVKRIFYSLHLSPRLVIVPLWLFKFSITILHVLPRFRHLTTAMAERMNHDLFFDHKEASHDFGYSPRPFDPSA